jgi:hypothetical protein
MRNQDTHIPDQELLRSVDGEVSGRAATRIQAHLAACWKCRARRAELERTIEEFVRAYQSSAPDELPAIDGPRAQLQARLRQVQLTESPTPWQRFRGLFLNIRHEVYAGLALTGIALAGMVVYLGVSPVRASSTPNSSLTPGATRSVALEEVCSPMRPEGFYPIPTTLAYRVFEKYNIRNPEPRSYEVDYLITPALGGADDIRNLWPQPFAEGEWNAHVKDALEDHLHRLVCSGEIELNVAQRDIASNWIVAYRKYFNTDRPLMPHTTFSLDPPWED